MRLFALASLSLAVSSLALHTTAQQEPTQPSRTDAAQQAAAKAIHAKTAYRDFLNAEQANGGRWTAQWHPATVTPSAIYGTGLRIADWRASAAEQAQTRRTLITILESMLRAIHPLMPFISEEIWQRVAPLAGACGETIMLQSWPDPSRFPVDEAAEAELQWIQDFVLGVRQIRGEMDIPPGKRLTVLLQDATTADRHLLDVHARYLRDLARLTEIRLLPSGEMPPACATALLGNLKILVPMAGLIDVAAERSRLEKNQQKLSD